MRNHCQWRSMAWGFWGNRQLRFFCMNIGPINLGATTIIYSLLMGTNSAGGNWKGFVLPLFCLQSVIYINSWTVIEMHYPWDSFSLGLAIHVITTSSLAYAHIRACACVCARVCWRSRLWHGQWNGVLKFGVIHQVTPILLPPSNILQAIEQY